MIRSLTDKWGRTGPSSSLTLSCPSPWYNGKGSCQSTINWNVLSVDIARVICRVIVGNIHCIRSGALTRRQESGYIGNFCSSKNSFIMHKESSASGVPSATAYRPNAFNCPILFAEPLRRAYSKVPSVMPVSINPGQIELTRISVWRSWYADVLAIEFTLKSGRFLKATDKTSFKTYAALLALSEWDVRLLSLSCVESNSQSTGPPPDLTPATYDTNEKG